MSEEQPAPFDGLVRIHQSLVRALDERPSDSALRPATGELPNWVPTFELMAYEATDTNALGLTGWASFHDIPDKVLDDAVRHIIDVEGPIHFRVLAERLLEAANVGRLGARIRDSIQKRLNALEARGELVQRGSFGRRAEQFRVPRLRDWSNVADKLRDLDHVPDT